MYAAKADPTTVENNFISVVESMTKPLSLSQYLINTKRLAMHILKPVSRIMHEEILKTIPVVRVNVAAVRVSKTSLSTVSPCMYVHIFHAAPQARLDGLGMPSEYVHNTRPAEAGKDGPRVGLYACS